MQSTLTVACNGTVSITKTCLYKFDPLQPHFFIVKLVFTGVYIIFLILLNNIDCGYSLEPPRRGGSNEYTQSTFWAEIWKISGFCLNIFEFLEVKSSIYLNRHVFVMSTTNYILRRDCACAGVAPKRNMFFFFFFFRFFFFFFFFVLVNVLSASSEETTHAHSPVSS